MKHDASSLPHANGAAAQPTPVRKGLLGKVERAIRFVRGNEKILWYLHSGYALLFGIGIMVLGARNFNYIRVVMLYIAFIWLSSLFLPAMINRAWIPARWRERFRLVVNYFNKNFYQQLLFFLLPIYYSSSTFGSGNVLFVVLLAASAFLSTLDIVYDRYLSTRWQLTALFFMFNVFACINVMLPVLWSVSNRWALWISAAIAFCGLASMVYRLSGLRPVAAKRLLVIAAVVLFLVIRFLAPYIPPAPLELVGTEFATSVRNLQVVGALDRLPPSPCQVALVTSIKAPLGLHETVRHRWRLDGKSLFVSRWIPVSGGREEGYRMWTQIALGKNTNGRTLTVDVETEGGQLIGRAKLKR